MTQHSAHDLCLAFLSQRKCGNEKKPIPFCHREGAERNTNLLRFWWAPSSAFSSPCECSQQLHSQCFHPYSLPLSNRNCLLLPGKKPVASATIAVLRWKIYLIFGQYDHRPPMQSKGRCRPSLKGKLKSCANVLHGISVLVSAKLHCFKNFCLHKAETEAMKAASLF